MARPRLVCLFLLAARQTSGDVIAANSPSFRGGFSEENREPVDAADDEPLIHQSSGRIELVGTRPCPATLLPVAIPTTLPPQSDTHTAVCRSSGRCSVARAQS